MVPPTLKCVFVGDGCSGKSAVIQYYVNGRMSNEFFPTVFENYTRTATYKGIKVNLMISNSDPIVNRIVKSEQWCQHHLCIELLIFYIYST